MKFLIAITLLAVAAATEVPEEEKEAQPRDKRGLLAAPIIHAPLPAAISYSTSLIHHAPPVAVAYHGYHAPIAKYIAPLPAVKVIEPLPIAKVVAPLPYAKLAYPSYPSPILPYYGYGYGYGPFH